MTCGRDVCTDEELDTALASAPVSRRRFLVGGSAAAGLATLAVACSKDKGNDPTTTTAAKTDLVTATMAAGLEKLAVDTYAAAGALATQGRLGAALPEAVMELMSTAAKQHQEHLDTWNTFLSAAGRPAVTAPDAVLKRTVDAATIELTDVPGAVTLALRLEDYASQTYLKAIPTLRSPDAVKVAARILVVDQQHQAILRYVLGMYPVGSGVVKDTKDFAPADPQLALVTG